MIRKCCFPAKGLKMEGIARLIYFDKTTREFDQELHNIIDFLRNHPDTIKQIGYKDFLDGNKDSICVILKISSTNNLSQTELDYINSITSN